MSLNIKSVDIKDLTHDPVNARKHDKRNLEAIANSLEAFGQRKPVVAMKGEDGGLVVIAGNGTLAAAKALGWKKLDVVTVPEDWDYAKARAFAIADNRTAELASWDEDVLVETLGILPDHYIETVGFNSTEMARLLGTDLFADNSGADERDEDDLASGQNTVVTVGSYKIGISRNSYDAWLVQARAEGGPSDDEVKALILERLGLDK